MNLLHRVFWPAARLRLASSSCATARTSTQHDQVADAKYSLHALRHAAAALWIEQRLGPKRIQTLMGHSRSRKPSTCTATARGAGERPQCDCEVEAGCQCERYSHYIRYTPDILANKRPSRVASMLHGNSWQCMRTIQNTGQFLAGLQHVCRPNPPKL